MKSRRSYLLRRIPRPSRQRSRSRAVWKVLPALLLGSLGGCEIPSEAPGWNTLWVLPGETTDITVAELLPADISVAASGDAFQLDVAPVTISQTLGQMCSGCAAFNGLIVPKPAFTASLSSSIDLPERLVSAELVGGSLEVDIEHDLSFDPLRPSATARGYLVIAVESGGTALARDSINGETTAFPAGEVLTRVIQLEEGTLAGPIDVEVEIFSPAGDPVRVDTSERLTLDVAANQVTVGEAEIQVTNEVVSTEMVELDLEDFDQEVTDRVKGGALRLELSNPFEVSGSLRVEITAPGVLIVKSVPVQPGASNVRVEFTAEELRSILGQSDVRMSVVGTVSSPSAGTSVRPSDTLSVRTRLELTIGPTED